ncbi:protein YacH [Enterobacter cloacae]|uniref:Protein YacH n=1 Tax=Enterobacter cloacae TaxID=550 RepID=A0A377M950_ENTCL|nr:protein YacH [Enterobacter cloacae]
MSLMGENPPWVQNLGDAFLAQPKDVMDSVQRLRALAQKTGALQSTPQQTVTTVTKPARRNRHQRIDDFHHACPDGDQN